MMYLSEHSGWVPDGNNPIRDVPGDYRAGPDGHIAADIDAG